MKTVSERLGGVEQQIEEMETVVIRMLNDLSALSRQVGMVVDVQRRAIEPVEPTGQPFGRDPILDASMVSLLATELGRRQAAELYLREVIRRTHPALEQAPGFGDFVLQIEGVVTEVQAP